MVHFHILPNHAVVAGLNAGWLGAASGIGVSLALQYWPRGDWTTPNRSAVLLSTVCCYGAGMTLALGDLAPRKLETNRKKRPVVLNLNFTMMDLYGTNRASSKSS